MDEIMSDCVLWTKARTGKYGQLTWHQEHWLAHRFAWFQSFGPIPKGLLEGNIESAVDSELLFGSYFHASRGCEIAGRQGALIVLIEQHKALVRIWGSGSDVVGCGTPDRIVSTDNARIDHKCVRLYRTKTEAG